MEITAKCVYDLKSVAALTRLQLFKKADPRKRMIFWSIVYGALTVLLLLEMLFWQAKVTHLLLLMIVFILLMCYLYFGFPKQMYKAQGNLRDAENTFVFGETEVRVLSRSAQYSGEAQIQYPLFVKAYETSEYFFLYQTKNQVFVVDKSTIQGGTAEEIRERLSGAVKKYIICRY